MSHRWTKLALIATTLATGLRATAQAPKDVPQDHWAYAAVEDLASKGLIKGYPPEGNFFGKRTVTRYEMATVVERVLARLDDLLAAKADKSAIPANTVTPQQLDEVKRLVDEFKLELTVIGGDVQKARDEIADLSTRLEAVNKQVQQNTAAIASTQHTLTTVQQAVQEQAGRVDAISDYLRGHKMTGYLQARYEAFDQGKISLFPTAGAGGSGQSPTTGGPAVGGPFEDFMVRRARISMVGNLGKQTDYMIEPDMGSVSAFTVKNLWVSVSNLPGRHQALTFGQFFTPFGFEINYSPSQRQSPERAIGFSDSTTSSPIFKTSLNATGGVVTKGSVLPTFINQEFDQGIRYTYAPPINGREDTKLILAVMNGSGGGAGVPAGNTSGFTVGGVRSTKSDPDVVGKITTTQLNGNLNVGVSGYYGSTPVANAPTPAGKNTTFVLAKRQFVGAYALYTMPWKTLLRAEYMTGMQETTPDRALYLPGNHLQAWYAILAHPVSKKLEADLMYDDFMPITEAGIYAAGYGRLTLERKAVSGGLRYWLDDHTRFRLWYQRGLTPYDPTATSGPLRDRLGYITGEIQITY